MSVIIDDDILECEIIENNRTLFTITTIFSGESVIKYTENLKYARVNLKKQINLEQHGLTWQVAKQQTARKKTERVTNRGIIYKRVCPHRRAKPSPASSQ